MNEEIKLSRLLLFQLLELPQEIRKYNVQEQYYYMYKKIDSLEKQNFFVDEKNINRENYKLTNRQEITWQNALMAFQRKDYLEAYFEIMDFVENYDSEQNRNLYEVEMKNIRAILNGIKSKIHNEIDLKEMDEKFANKQIIKEIKGDSNKELLAIDFNKKYTGMTGILSMKILLEYNH